MKRFVCTPRDQVIELYDGQKSVTYYDVGPLDTPTGRTQWRTGFPEYLQWGLDDSTFFPERITRSVGDSNLRFGLAPCIEIARVNFHADAALRDVLQLIRRAARSVEWRLTQRRRDFAKTT